MNIVEVCPYDLARPGGVQRHVIDLAHALAAAGHRVTVLSPGGGAAGPASVTLPGGGEARFVSLGRFRVVRVLGTAFELSLASRAEVDAALADAQPEVVHFHTLWTPALNTRVWRALDAWPGVARVATFHDTPPEGWQGDVMRAAFRVLSARLSRRLQAAIAVSASPLRHLRLAPGCEPLVLPACIDLAPYAALDRAADPTPPDADDPYVLFIGRLEPRKGLPWLLDAWARVAPRHPRVQLRVCGDGPQAAQVREQAQRLGLADRVRFEGAVDESTKRRLLAGCTLFCAPSLFGESYGLVLTEAMACGRPVIAAANSGYREVLAGAGAAGLVAPGDVAALAARLDEWLADPARRAAQSAWGRSAWRAADVGAQRPVFEALFARAVQAVRPVHPAQAARAVPLVQVARSNDDGRGQADSR